jgi:hypothetical protein
MDRRQKLEAWAERALYRNISNLIADNPDGSILAYGKYLIKQAAPGRFTVTDLADAVTSFGSKKSALSWCTANRYQDLNLARYILQLDTQKTQIRQDIEQRQQLTEICKNSQFRDRVMVKLESKKNFFRNVSIQLEKCMNRAKYLQLRGLQNETARTRRI